ncbi:cobalt-precorrin-5B C(1)-methyltransferase [Clostridium polyendosporum]|uniref:Cobalt-precorrin-5B C(1)-methyltransferase n=1 Tax=Clostridium polyendosporum TaxID=69208 RepID=A0A919RXA4_9CLOT|nr:cobalt-precorrin-5B (C(1))-methyltransferase CbiD [Clostridium polyendosporum]GIM28190.1 cobalt-precorrin-5B C(1)-methyltransferase [Clostridium polyendosporum]
MKLDMYIVKEGKKLRCGYTTGSCAAGAAKAAATAFFNGSFPEFIEIDTPAEVVLKLKVEDPFLGEDYASCCIVKDAGDDPDATDGMQIYARISKRTDNKVVIDGGDGIGRITRGGFIGEVGEAAINPVPRRMIETEIRKVTDEGVDIVIYAPMGREVGKKTFNANIGIEGGISIIGTKGIVQPMSEEALKESIFREIDGIDSSGAEEIILYPGNYGEEVAKSLSRKEQGVKISNFIGEVISYCYYKGFKKVTLVGHIGKLCKVSIGGFNTHSRTCDIRMESLVYYLAINGAPQDLILQVQKCVTSEEALKIILDRGYKKVIDDMKIGCVERLKKYIKDTSYDIEVIMYSMEYGVL